MHVLHGLRLLGVVLVFGAVLGGCAVLPAPSPAPPPVPAPPAPSSPPPSPPPPPAAPAPTSEKVTFAADAFFSAASAKLRPEGLAKLEELAEKTAGISLEVVIAVGHADTFEVVDADAAQRLSMMRAEAVKTYLASAGESHLR